MRKLTYHTTMVTFAEEKILPKTGTKNYGNLRSFFSIYTKKREMLLVEVPMVGLLNFWRC